MTSTRWSTTRASCFVVAFLLSVPVARGQTALPLPVPRIPSGGVLPPPTLRRPICVEVGTLEVRAGAPAPGSGSAASPFPTLAAAFEHARSSSACRLVVRVAAGTYGADLEVTRPTEILGASRTTVLVTGSLVNRTASSLTVRHATLRNAPGPAVLVESGATTTLEDVTVSSARRFGVQHRGGTLIARNVRVESTVAGAGDRLEGTGIHLTGGAHAELTDVLLSGNASAALVARGAGVRVVARRVTARDTGTNPNFSTDTGPVRTTFEPIEGSVTKVAPSGTLGLRSAPTLRALPVALPQFRMRTEGGLFGLAAVEISQGATLLAEDLRVERSALFGLAVFSGARANVRRLTALATRNVQVSQWSHRGGNNVVVSDDAILEGTEVDSSQAAGAGVVVYRAWLTLHSATIHHNVIGMGILEPRGDGVRCLEGIRVSDNDTEFSYGLGSIPVPEPPTDLFGDAPPPPPPDCGTVPWD